MDNNRIYTVKEVARLLGFSTNTIYKYLDEGKIKSTRLGNEGRFRIPGKEVAKLLGLKGVKSQITSNLKPGEDHNLEAERELFRDASSKISDSSEETQTDSDFKSRLRTPVFMAISTAMFFLLFTLGMRNINIAAAKNLQLLPTTEVLSETEEAIPTEEVKPTEEINPEIILKIKMEDASSSASIYQGPTTDSRKIGEARDGDIFKYVYLNSDWYEIRLADGTTGFISRGFIVRGETEEIKPEIVLKARMKNASASASIRQSPTADSRKIGEARGGDTFEYVSMDSGWYEIKLADGTTGFISEEFIVKEGTDK